jgi:hypothetical protein
MKHYTMKACGGGCKRVHARARTHTHTPLLTIISGAGAAIRSKTNFKASWPPLLSAYVRFEVFAAVTMKNGVFWDVTPCGSCKNRRSVCRLLVTASVVPMKNGVFWDVMPCGSCENRRFGGT